MGDRFVRAPWHTPKRSWRVLAVLLLGLAAADAAVASDEWTGADTARQAAFTGVTLIDWAQTRYIVQNPRFHENNPLLGSHPSAGQVDAYFALTIVGHAAISYILPRGWREGWQYIWIGGELRQIAANRSLGIGVRMPF